MACPQESISSSLSPVSTNCPPPECSAEVAAVNQTIKVIQDLEEQINKTITEFNSLCDDGDDPRDTPPPTIYGEEIDEEASYCGPDVTSAFMAALARVHRRMKNLPDNEKGIVDAADPLFSDSFLPRNGTNIDQKPLLPKDGICPSGACSKDGNSVGQPCYTLFGKCVPEHVLNDIMFGFVSDQLYIPEVVQAIGGAYHQYSSYGSWEPDTSREAYDFGDEISEDFDAGEVPTPDTVQDDLKLLMADVVSDYPWIKDCKACPDTTPLSEWKGDFSRRAWKLHDGKYLNDDGTITNTGKESEKEKAEREAEEEQQRTAKRLSEVTTKLAGEMEQLGQHMDLLAKQRTDLSKCEETCGGASAFGRFFGEIFTGEVIDVKSITGNNPYDRQNPDAENSDQISSGSGSGQTIQVLPGNIPVSRFAGPVPPDSCPEPHFHAFSVNDCDNVLQADPAPLVCGFGGVSQITSIPLASCANP